MKKQKVEEEMIKYFKDVSEEIISIFDKNQTDLLTACAILGGITAHFAYQSNEASAYLSFFQSFSHTVEAIQKSQTQTKKIKSSK